MVALGPGHPHGRGREVVQVVLAVGRQLDRVQREHVVILARHVPGHVRLVQAEGEEERLVVRLPELVDAVLDDLPLAQVLVLAVQRGELDAADAGVAGRPRVGALGLRGSRPTRRGGAYARGRSCPPRGRSSRPCGRSSSAVRSRGDRRAPVVVVLVDAGRRGPQPGHQRGPRGIADRRGAVAVREPRRRGRPAGRCSA